MSVVVAFLGTVFITSLTSYHNYGWFSFIKKKKNTAVIPIRTAKGKLYLLSRQNKSLKNISLFHEWETGNDNFISR